MCGATDRCSTSRPGDSDKDSFWGVGATSWSRPRSSSRSPKPTLDGSGPRMVIEGRQRPDHARPTTSCTTRRAGAADVIANAGGVTVNFTSDGCRTSRSFLDRGNQRATGQDHARAFAAASGGWQSTPGQPAHRHLHRLPAHPARPRPRDLYPGRLAAPQRGGCGAGQIGQRQHAYAVSSSRLDRLGSAGAAAAARAARYRHGGCGRPVVHGSPTSSDSKAPKLARCATSLPASGQDRAAGCAGRTFQFIGHGSGAASCARRLSQGRANSAVPTALSLQRDLEQAALELRPVVRLRNRTSPRTGGNWNGPD